MARTIEKMSREEAIDKVVGDNRRVSYEKETTIRFNREEKVFFVNSFDPTIIKGLLGHEYFEISDCSKNESGKIIGISGRLPRGIIKIKKRPRKRNYSSTIISREGKEK